MNRRSFIKAVSAFVAVAAAAPKTLVSQPVDWLEWNSFELFCQRGEIVRMLINGRDFTSSLEARRKLAEVLTFKEDGIVFGRDGVGTKWVIPEGLPNKFTMGFALMLTPDKPPPVAVDGNLSRQFNVSDMFAISDSGG